MADLSPAVKAALKSLRLQAQNDLNDEYPRQQERLESALIAAIESDYLTRLVGQPEAETVRVGAEALRAYAYRDDIDMTSLIYCRPAIESILPLLLGPVTARVAELKALLIKYGAHSRGCLGDGAHPDSGKGFCTCGFAEACPYPERYAAFLRGPS